MYARCEDCHGQRVDVHPLCWSNYFECWWVVRPLSTAGGSRGAYAPKQWLRFSVILLDSVQLCQKPGFLHRGEQFDIQEFVPQSAGE
jgi:hypothetical protein